MALENIANTTLTLDHDVDQATLVIPTPPSTKFKNGGGKNIFRGVITVNVSNAASGSCSAASGTAIINSSGKLKNNNLSVLREGDSGVGTVFGTDSGSPCSFDITVDVQDAGQDKHKSE